MPPPQKPSKSGQDRDQDGDIDLGDDAINDLNRVSRDLRNFLDPQIRQGLVDVIEDADKTTVRIRGDGLFASGSANVKPAFLPLLAQIGKELNTVQGRVLVTGHSDSVPIHTLQFPSNWHLAKARADSVV